MKRDYYDRDLGIFIAGIVAGAIWLLVFVSLKKYGYETLAWIFMAGTAGMICAAWGMSKMLSEVHELDEIEELNTESAGSQQLPTPAPLFIAKSNEQRDEVPSGTLTFPYATRALEAARQATLKFWTEYDPERPPLQKSVQGYIAEKGIPARQAAELASAIKPDNVSDRSDTLPDK